MKKILSLVLTTTFLCSSSVSAMDEGLFEKDFIPSKTSSSHVSLDKKREALLKYRERLEGEKDFYEDQYAYLGDVQKEYKEDLTTKGEIHALNIISKKLGTKENFSSDAIDSFLSQALISAKAKSQMLHEDLIDLDNTLKTCGKSIDKVKIVFSSLWKRHTDTLEVRLRTLLERKRELELRKIVENGEDDSYNCENEDLSLLLKIKSNGGTPFLPPTCQSYLDEETSEINKEFSRTAKESYQHRLYFLKTLYKLVKEHLTDEQLASIQLNKNLRDVLEEKVKNLGHSDQALETLPSAKDIENAIRYWNKNKNKSILVYYHRPSRLEKKEKVFVKDNERKPTISWDRVTLQNIDDVLPQVSHFFPNLTEKSKSSIRDFLKQKREKLKFQLKKKFEILKYEISLPDNFLKSEERY